MILSYVCIIIIAIIAINRHSRQWLKGLGLDSLSTMLLLLVAAILTILPSPEWQMMGIDYLSVMLIAVAVYITVKRGFKRLVPIFGGIIGVAVMSLLYQYATRQLFRGAWESMLFISIIAVASVVVANGGESIVSAILGVAVAQIVLVALPSLGMQVNYQPIGGVILASIIVVVGLNCLWIITHKTANSLAIRRKQ